MPRIDPRTARSRGFVEPPRRPGVLMRGVLFVWFLLRFAVAAAVTGAFAALCILLWFGFTMPEAAEEPEGRTDAIVVLTGGEERLERAYALLQKGLAARLFVTGAGERTTKPDILKRLDNPPAELADRIELGYRAANTRDNASETAAWFNSQNLKSMRLVTSNYHMRRSLLHFGRAMPHARILADPVVPKRYGAGEWWTHADGVRKVAEELGAYLAAMFYIPVRR
jgi:uncharacterized SAM-binding protein YcdF (DUF218 family)